MTCSMLDLLDYVLESIFIKFLKYVINIEVKLHNLQDLRDIKLVT